MSSEAPQVSLNPRAGWLGWWPEGGIRSVIDPENGRIRAFLTQGAAELPEGALVLDASACARPYAPLFHRQRYESCDMPGGFYEAKHDFECFLDAIPRPDATYDAILLTQVLEHVHDPATVLAELKRILKPGGVLYLSVPLTAPLHGEPWHFFHFTHYGLAELARRTGWKIRECEKVGGAFWLLGKRLGDLPRKLMKQVDPFRAKRRGLSVSGCVVATLLFLPFWLLGLLLLTFTFRPLCYWLDRFDFEKSFTIGYTAVFTKE